MLPVRVRVPLPRLANAPAPVMAPSKVRFDEAL